MQHTAAQTSRLHFRPDYISNDRVQIWGSAVLCPPSDLQPQQQTSMALQDSTGSAHSMRVMAFQSVPAEADPLSPHSHSIPDSPLSHALAASRRGTAIIDAWQPRLPGWVNMPPGTGQGPRFCCIVHARMAVSCTIFHAQSSTSYVHCHEHDAAANPFFPSFFSTFFFPLGCCPCFIVAFEPFSLTDCMTALIKSQSVRELTQAVRP